MLSNSSHIPLPILSGPSDSARALGFGGYTQQVQGPHLPQTTFSPMARQFTPGPVLRHGFNPFIDESQLLSGFASHPPPTSTWPPNPVPPYPDDPYFNPFHEFFGTTPLPYFPEHQYYGHNPPLARTPFPSMPTSFVDVPPNFGGPAHPNEMLPRHNSLPPSYTGRPPRHLEPQGTSITTSSRDASQVVARRTRSRSPHSKASTRCGHDNFEVYRVRDRD
ncbi:hypothetical protein JCM16303_003071 [Sporobolomyces ruberrimus]